MIVRVGRVGSGVAQIFSATIMLLAAAEVDAGILRKRVVSHAFTSKIGLSQCGEMQSGIAGDGFDQRR
ncbi:hypothetical protein BST42_03060 [Mycolicibacterium rhodesiae]|uniref:Uncharacterized protein n=1 Tax=Mycolicibacterium rhodesiae TaxID=36814 RepID=A0A1X0J5E2_MYCRH|nr:hypothetical protein BST42_03060 [Mycolicibacterium rhodesiae]